VESPETELRKENRESQSRCEILKKRQASSAARRRAIWGDPTARARLRQTHFYDPLPPFLAVKETPDWTDRYSM